MDVIEQDVYKKGPNIVTVSHKGFSEMTAPLKMFNFGVYAK